MRTLYGFIFLGVIFLLMIQADADTDDPRPPDKTARLIFIHHSCGENWLADGHGNLGRALAENNYFVSDTNYGWGPNSIGDRTDITDWPEWFTGPESSRYLEALFKESGIRSPYTRNLRDPGGENRIILFKSCFPNSNLEGKPRDLPERGNGLTMKNAKAIYNELLRYFSARQDKLFIVITAPPVQDKTYAANARAFNTWLVRDWLAGYQGGNVGVFDFYNVLTGPGNHHRFQKGKVEYITNRGRNTLYYPSNGDDHPSSAGNRKATKEFVPLLNIYYNRWIKNAPGSPSLQAETKPLVRSSVIPKPTTERPPHPLTKLTPRQQAGLAGGMIDNFEGSAKEWAVFSGEDQNTRLTFARDRSNRHTGEAALRIDYSIPPAGWATCSLVYPSSRNWGSNSGVSLYIHSSRIGQKVIIVVYQGNSPDNLSHFEFETETKKEAVIGWQQVNIAWNKFHQPSWQGDPSVPFDPVRTMGIAFAFNASERQKNAGQLWVDDIKLLSKGAGD